MRSKKLGIWLVAATAIASTVAYGQQVVDPNYDATVTRPAYTTKHPKVLFDEAHNNFHTSSGHYKPFASLITNDGFAVTPNRVKLDKKTLEGYDILLIANALGAARQNLPDAGNPAFTDEECDAVRDWVKAGGSLLLIADHAPFGSAAQNMATRFGVDMNQGHTSDPDHHDSETGNMSFLVFTRAGKLLGDHPITRGRSANEQINNVMTFTGQSLKGPPGSTPFLVLSDTARDVKRPPRDSAAEGATTTDRLPDGRQLPPGASVRISQGGAGMTSAAGRAQAVAFDFGKGRVVVLGEAGMLSAQIVKGAPAQMMGQEEVLMGMNRKGIDNRQLALNIMHWLSRLLN